MPPSGGSVVGILGGMGPEATVDLMRRVIALTPAQDDADHVHMLVDNNPQVPSRIAALIDGTGESPVPTLVAMAQRLQQQGADFLAMPCNTAHHYHADIAAAVSVPFLHMPQLVAAAVARDFPNVTGVGLLASTAVTQIELYEPCFTTYDLTVSFPDPARQGALMALIRSVKGVGPDAGELAAATAAAADLAFGGAELLVLACTELSVLAGQLDLPLPTLDAADVLAWEIVRRAVPTVAG